VTVRNGEERAVERRDSPDGVVALKATLTGQPADALRAIASRRVGRRALVQADGGDVRLRRKRPESAPVRAAAPTGMSLAEAKAVAAATREGGR
jgi:hypothetical protein